MNLETSMDSRVDLVELENADLGSRSERAAIRHAPIPKIPPGAPWNATEEVILRRRSIRKYKPVQVPAHLVRRIVELGRFAPSQGNCQPWSFVVVRDRDLLEKMEAHCVGVCKFVMATPEYANVHPVPALAISNIASGRFRVFHKAPTVILILMDKRGVGVPEVDVGIVGQNIVLGAQSLGLGTCWIGFSKFLNGNAALMQTLGIAPPFEIVEAITVGWPFGVPSLNTVERQTHEIAWFEDGRKEVFY